ncbi:MAG: putative repeat protein (TIGR01451 family), partial [Arenicella sp.]
YTDAIEIGFLNATAAGVYVAASAGNSGPGASTVAHLGPWVSTTAASTHNRALKNSVVSMNSDNGPLADIIGAGFTDSYGPAEIINSAKYEVTHPGSTECGLGSIGDFISPWPAGFFNGEIVACTRGTFGRVEKGANVLAAGAGGYILMDTGGGIVGDSHVLPGVHISQANSAVLTAWLAAGNANTIGTINGVFVDLADANADIMAGFSSRGPNLAFDVIKPDISAPGVSIMAAAADPDDYQFLSGTSMSSPHNAGAGALISAIRPDWTPYEIQSALMMTSSTEMLKEDGLTPTDPFDRGAGRINLQKARDAALVLDETPANFFASDPAAGGDPKTLNIASMQNSNCVGDCSWTRTVKNVSGQQLTVNLEATGPVGLGLSTSSALNLDPGESGNVTVSVDARRATAGWNFAELELQTNNGSPTLHMPIAVVASAASNPDMLTKTVDAAEAVAGEVLSYEINITNTELSGLIDMTDVLPTGLNFVPGSQSSVITNGSTLSPFAAAGGELNWQGELDQGGLIVGPGSAPFGYFPLSFFGITPLGCPGNCDDGGFAFNVPAYVFNGQTYTSVIMSVNGTLEAGTASGLASSYINQNLPDATAPNNILAPFWTDLNMDPDPASGGGVGGGGNWYIGVLNAGPDQFTIYEWENVPLWGDLSNRYTFQIWVQNGTSGNIWYTYDQLGTTFLPATVGVENDTGTGGDSYFYNATGTDPVVGQALQVLATTGGTATFNFQAQVDYCAEDAIVNRADLTTLDDAESAIAVTECMSNGAGTAFIFDGRAVVGCPLDAIQKTYACVADATSPTDTITIAAGYKVNQVAGHMYAATITLAANSELVIVGNNKSLFATSTVALGAGAKMDGNIYAGTTVALGADAETDGDIYAGTTLALGAGASTTGSLNAGTTVALGANALITGDVTGGTTVVLAANSNVTGDVTSINSYVDLGAGARVEGFTTSETGATTLGAGASTCQTVTAVTATLGAGASVRGNLHAVTTTLGANAIVTGNLGGPTGVTTTLGADACFGTMSSGMTTTLGAGAGVCASLQNTTAGDRCL